MTAPNGSPLGGALEAVRRLEGALEAGNQARAEAEAALDAAREEAERLLADARAVGSVAGRRRRAEVLEASEAEAMAIRAAAEADAEELHGRVSAERHELVAELASIVLGREASGAPSHDQGADPRSAVRGRACIDELHQLGLVEIADARPSEAIDELGGDEARSARREALRLLATQVDSLLAEVPVDAGAEEPAQVPPVRRPLDARAVRVELERLAPVVEALRKRQEALRDESLVLPGYLEPLRRLLPLAPEIVDLDDGQLRLLRLGTVALVLNTEDERFVDTLREALAEELGERFHLAWTRVADGGIGCLVVFPVRLRRAVQALLGRAQVRQAALPDAFERLSLSAAVEAMQRRLVELPQAISAVRAEREALLLPQAARLRMLHVAIAGEFERLDAVDRFGGTRRAFVAVCWVPRRQLARLADELETRLGCAVLVEDLATSPRDPQAPLLMRNSALARPFEPLVRFLDLPRAGSFDPTFLTALFLPLMFGAMVGDVGYGAVLLALGLIAHRSLAARALAGRPDLGTDRVRRVVDRVRPAVR